MPERPYQFAEWLKARVNINYHVDVKQHHYSVPFRPKDDQLDIRLTATTVEAFHRGERVAAHVRSYVVGGYTAFYVRAPRLFETLGQARGDGTQMKALGRLAKVQLLIIDDFLLTPLAPAERKDFLEVIEDRYKVGSTVIASQCPVKQWHEAIGDPTLADAILDRLVHNAYKFALRGGTMREKENGTS